MNKKTRNIIACTLLTTPLLLSSASKHQVPLHSYEIPPEHTWHSETIWHSELYSRTSTCEWHTVYKDKDGKLKIKKEERNLEYPSPNEIEKILNRPLEKEALLKTEFGQYVLQLSQDEKDELLQELVRCNDPQYYNGYRDLIATAIYAGANPNIKKKDITDENPLRLAVLHQDYILTELLLKHNARLDYWRDQQRSHSDKPPIFLAESKKLAQLLIRYGSRTDEVGFLAGNLLHSAMSSDHEAELVQFYLDQNVDPNHADKFGCTPLHILAIFCNDHDEKELKQKAELLIAAGVKFDKKSDRGKTAEDFARNDQCSSCKLLIDLIRAAEKKQPKK